MPPCPRITPWVFAGSHSIPFSQISLPVVEDGVSVEVKVKGVVDGVPGHSQALRVIVPFSPQSAVKQAPSPSVVL